MTWLLTVDVGWYLAAVFAVIVAAAVGLLLPMVVAQVRHQRSEDAAVARWRAGSTGE